MDTKPLSNAETRRRLEPLTGRRDRPFRDLAREALGVALLYAGKADGGAGRLPIRSCLSLSPQVSEGMRASAPRRALAIIDAGTAAVDPRRRQGRRRPCRRR